MTAQQLKNSILQMAVQGKLVPQDPNDEPASVLLDRIRKEKEQLIKDGKIKKNKKESYIFRGADNLHYEQIGKEVRCIEDELPFEIPVNWAWCRMNSIGTMIRGNGIKRCEIVDEGLPCIRYGEIYTSYNLEFRKVFSKIPQQLYDSCKKIKHGDLIFTLTGENKPDIAKTIAYLGDTEIAAGGDLAIWSNHHMNPLYLSYLLYSPYMISKKISLATGDIIVHISVDKVGSFLAPIPPLEEQNKIVNRLKMLESLISKYSEKENELYVLNSNIKEQLKKSILQYAIEGKLVPQDLNDEPATVLLERMHKEKEKLIADKKIKKDKNESMIYRRDNSYYEKFDKCERCINDQIPFEIPNSWCWERLSSFCIINMGSSPKGNSINSDEKGGYEFHQGKSFFSSKHLLKSNVYTNQPTKLCPSSSVLLSVRAPVGKVNIVDRTICIGRGLASIKPFIDFEIELLYYFLTTLEPYFIDHSTGSTFKAITSNIVKDCLLPVPPKNEQNRLLVAIKKIFSLLN